MLSLTIIIPPKLK